MRRPFLFSRVGCHEAARYYAMRNRARLLASVVVLCAANTAPSAPPKVAPKYQEGSCCDKAAKKGDKCIHPCCVKAAKAAKVCDHCNESPKK